MTEVAKFEYAEKVKETIVSILQDIPDAKSVIENCKGKCEYILDSEARLERIVFDFYERLEVERTRVLFVPERGKAKVLMTYENFDRLFDATPEELQNRYQIL